MKRKTRTITVNNKKYIWRPRIGHTACIMFSPESSKTSAVTLEFPCNSQYKADFIRGAELTKNGEIFRVNFVEPKGAALLLTYLSEHKAFVPRRNIRINGFELLARMGYTVSGLIY